MENDTATITNEDEDFAAGFNETVAAPAEQQAADATEPEPTPAEAPAQAAAATGEADGSADKTADEPAADPFAGLPPAVRDLLAEIPTLRTRAEQADRELHRVKELAGRVPGLMSEVAKFKVPAAPAPVTENAKVKALREQGLDEIADAIEAVAAPAKTAEPAPAPTPQPAAPAAAPSDPQTEALDELRPGWAEEITGTDFQLMLAAKGRDYANRIASTNKAKDILAALKDFDEYRASHAQAPAAAPTPPPPAPAGGSRQARIAAAVTPSGDGRPGSRRPQPLDEDAEFEAGFHGRSP